MHVTSRMISVLVCALLMFMAAASALAAARDADPVVVEGINLGSALDQPVDSIGVYKWSGFFEPVLFQIDERMEVSAYNSWFTRVSFLSYAFDNGPEAESDPDPMFDDDDELVFMARDAGERAPGGQGPAGAVACDELKIHEPDGSSESYAYVCVMNNPVLSPSGPLVSMPGEDTVKGESYEVGYPEGNPFNFDMLRTAGPDGEGKDVVDRMKYQVQVQVATGIAYYELTENEYDIFLRGYKVGPVRAIREFEMVLETWGGAQIRTYNHVIHYPRHIEHDLLARGALNWGKSFNRSNLVLAVDLGDAGRGMTFISDKNKRGETADGRSLPSEIYMDYGPAEWAAVTGEEGTLIAHLGLGRRTELHKDLYYSDNDERGDPYEEEPGTVGKFGFVVRNLQKAGFKKFPVRFMIYADPKPYSEGMEKELLGMYQDPLKVNIDNHDIRALQPEAPMIADDREQQPMSPLAEQDEGLTQTKFLLPSFIYDPNLLGVGPGVGYVDLDLLGTGTFLGTSALWTDRGYAYYGLDISELRFIKGVESFRFHMGYDSFPAQPYYGQGNDSDKDNKTFYWWRKNEVEVTFTKYFANIYGADFEIGYREISIDSGIEPASGDGGVDSIEERYGRNRDLIAARLGPPVYGLDGGNHTGFKMSLYRDMRNAKYLPKIGNYQEIELEGVSSALGADYDYLRVGLDLRAYWHPDFLNPLPWDDNVNPRRTFLTKFAGPDKNRAFAGRIVFRHLIADEIEYEGRDILDVPFYELTKIGSSSSIKGFSSSRFIDNDAVFMNFEYRWTWWKFLDYAVFYDVGMVMDDLFEGDGWDEEWHQGYGISTRIHLPPNIIVTFELAWSEEEAAIQHQANIAF